jgi:hypothetical protein
MTVSTELVRSTHGWTGVETSFATGWPADKIADVKGVFVTGAGVESALTQGVHFSVTLASGTKLATCAPIAMPAPAGTIKFYRETPALNEIVLVDGQNFPATTHQQLHDRAALRDAEAKDNYSRVIKLTPGDTAFDAGSKRIVNLAAPTGANDAARKTDVDAIAGSAAAAAASAASAAASASSASSSAAMVPPAFATRAAAISATLGASVLSITLLGWATQGDGGGGRWIKAASEPTHGMKLQTADGAWWELARGQFYDIRMFGVIVGPHGAAPADSTTALVNMNGYDPGAVFIPPGIVKGNLVITNRIYLWGSGGTHEGLTDVIAISGGSAFMAAVTSTPVIDVRANSTTLENFHVYGGSGGGVKIGHVVSGVSCTTVSGSTTVTVPGGGMTAGDVGKFIRIETSGGPAYRTIAAFGSATSITVDSSAGLLSETVTMSYGAPVTHVRLEDISTNYGCQRGIDVRMGGSYHILNCYAWGYAAALYLDNVLNPDTGDSAVIGGVFNSDPSTGACVHHIGGGSVRFQGIKFAQGQHHYRMRWSHGSSASVMFVNNTWEDCTGASIHVENSYPFNRFTIGAGNNFGAMSCPVIVFSDVPGVGGVVRQIVIDGATFDQTGGAVDLIHFGRVDGALVNNCFFNHANTVRSAIRTSSNALNVKIGAGNNFSNIPAGGYTVWDQSAQGQTTVISATGGDNRLVNGDAMIDQRNSGAAATVSDGAYGGPDMWVALAQSNPITMTRLAAPGLGIPFAMRLTQANASAQRLGACQIVESTKARAMQSGRANINGAVRSSVDGIALRWALLGWNGTADATTRDVVNDWTSTNFTPSNFFIAGVTVVAAGSIGLAADTWTNLPGVSGVVPSDANNLVAVIWTDQPPAQNATVDFRLKVEPGDLPSTWRQSLHTLEEEECQRFLVCLGGQTSITIPGRTTSTTNFEAALRYPSRMRATPVVSVVNVTDIAVNDGSVQNAASALGSTLMAADSGRFNVTSTGLTAFRPGWATCSTGTGRFDISAELGA